MENETKKSENINEPITENKADTAILSDEDVRALTTEMLQKFANTLKNILSVILPGHNVNSLITYIGTSQTLAANLCAILEDDSIEFSRYHSLYGDVKKEVSKVL